MKAFIDVVGYLNLVAFTGLGLAALRQWFARRDRASLWAALAFGALAVVVLAGRILPDDPDTELELRAANLTLAVLVLFPYLLYRFMRTFSTRTGWPDPVIPVLTIALVAWSLALPELPEEGEPRPGWFLAFLAVFLAHWTLLTVVVSVRLWLAGRGQPSVARKRMRMLAAASASITVAILFAGAGAAEGSLLDAVTSVLVFLSAIGFLVGLTPPGLVRMAWRRPEQDRFRDAVAELMSATTPQEVAEDVLPGMAALVGARAVALLDADGRLLGAHGASDEMLSDAFEEANGVLHIELPAVRSPSGRIATRRSSATRSSSSWRASPRSRASRSIVPDCSPPSGTREWRSSARTRSRRGSWLSPPTSFARPWRASTAPSRRSTGSPTT